MSDSVRPEFQAVFNYLKSQHFHFLEKWVIECVSHYKSTNPEMSTNELLQEVHNQWLLVNLRDLKVSALPPNLKTYDKLTLPGKYMVQVETMIDASQSSYSQLQTIRNVNLENVKVTKQTNEWEIKSSRCLTMTLCDGVQEIKGMEYQPIKALRLNDPDLLPGFKMLLIGPLICRKGMLLLKQQNIKVCGGEVDTLCASNSLELLILRKLNIEHDPTSVAQQNQNNHIQQNLNHPVSADTNRNDLNHYNDDQNAVTLLSQIEDDDLLMNLSMEDDLPQEHVPENIPAALPIAPVENTSQANSLDFDDEVMMDNMVSSTYWEPQEEQSQATNSRTNSTNLVTSSGFTQTPHSSRERMPSPAVKRPIQSTLNSFIASKSKKLNDDPKIERKGPVVISSEPFVYLKHISKLQITTNQEFTVKAAILTLLTKVTIKNDEFTLRAVISDGSLSIEADFSSDVLEDILGFSPCEMIVMMKERSRNSAIADRIKASFQKTQQKLISLNCLMRLRFFSDCSVPDIIGLEEIQRSHLNALKMRQIV